MKKLMENLCYHDKRNPDHNPDDETKLHAGCYCDNCFNGRTELAERALELMEKLNDIQFRSDL